MRSLLGDRGQNPPGTADHTAADVTAFSYSDGVGAAELWVEAYQGEVLGEALFGLLAKREEDPHHRRQLEGLTLLERATRDLAGPVFVRRSLDHGDSAGTVRSATEMADALVDVRWEDFLGSFEPVITQFLTKYRALVDLAEDDIEAEIAEAYVAHEQALASFIRRALGQEAGEPLQPIFELPHVAAALPA